MNKPRGFTLMELLVTFTVIAILIALLFPAWTRIQQSSQRTVCLNRLHQLGRAQIAYSSDNDGWITPNRFTDGQGTAYWPQLLLPYLGEQPAFLPTAPRTSLFTCPSAKNPTSQWVVKPLCYSQNISLGGSNLDNDAYPPMTRRIQVHKPSKMVLLGDGGDVNMASWSIDEGGNSDPSKYRHDKRINLVLLDGHIESAVWPLSPEKGNRFYNWNVGSENN